MLEFEFDERKSLINEEKHGIDFLEAQKLWDDSDRIVIPAKNLDEQRFLLIGNIKNRFWSVIFTYRLDKIRIISVRHSRINEIGIYESK